MPSTMSDSGDPYFLWCRKEDAAVIRCGLKAAQTELWSGAVDGRKKEASIDTVNPVS